MKPATLAAPLLLAIAVSAQEKAPQNDSIRKQELRADLFFLAGDSLRGRLTATPENALAADWIKSRFERLGLAPGGSESSFFHPYSLSTASLGEGNLLEVVGPGGAAQRQRSGQDFYPLRFSATGRVRAGIVFAGYGIVAPELQHDDYRGELRGKVVLLLDHEPGERDSKSPFDGVVSAEVASPLRKALAAQDKGAAAVLFVEDVHNHPGQRSFEAAARGYWPDKPPRIERYSLGWLVERLRIPAAQISPALAEALVRGTGKKLEDLGRLAETPRGMPPLALAGQELELTTAVDRHVFSDRNVLAKLEGSDPKLRDEWVVVCAHYDHNGADGDQVWNGADDDGSGTVALLEIAEAYALAAQAGARPRRSILFAAWNSEERGLLGAWAFAERPPQPLERIAAVLNMDMIGRSEEVPEGGGARFRGLELQTAESNKNAVNVLGASRSAELLAALKEANAGIGLELKLRYDNNVSQLLRRSDHWPFLQKGVPAIWFLTGLHPDYHTVYDRPEKIDYGKMERITRLVHQLSWKLAQQDGRPRLDERKP